MKKTTLSNIKKHVRMRFIPYEFLDDKEQMTEFIKMTNLRGSYELSLFYINKDIKRLEKILKDLSVKYKFISENHRLYLNLYGDTNKEMVLKSALFKSEMLVLD